MVLPSDSSFPSDHSSPIVSLSSSDDSFEQSFSDKRINIRLDDTNYLLWKQLVTLMMRCQGHESYPNDSISPPSKLVLNNNGEHTPNPAYLRVIKQDSFLASWLLSTGPKQKKQKLPNITITELTAARTDTWASVSVRFGISQEPDSSSLKPYQYGYGALLPLKKFDIVFGTGIQRSKECQREYRVLLAQIDQTMTSTGWQRSELDAMPRNY